MVSTLALSLPMLHFDAIPDSVRNLLTFLAPLRTREGPPADAETMAPGNDTVPDEELDACEQE